jgi:hypothetical protein
MGEAFYRLLEDSAAGSGEARGRVRSSLHTNGPWGPGLQHAGPPSALLLRAATRLGGLPERALPARLTFDILAPVPVADLVVSARTLRPGRRVALVRAALATAAEPDRPVMVLHAWLVRQRPAEHALAGLPPTPSAAAPPGPDGMPPMALPAGWHPGYLEAVEWRWVEGAFEEPGPATVWTSLRVALVEDEPADPLQRLVAVADAASGISAVASPTQLLFVNTDLTLHLTRAPQGDWIWMRAESTLDPAGIGRATGELGDADGALARSAQCLFVEPRS